MSNDYKVKISAEDKTRQGFDSVKSNIAGVSVKLAGIATLIAGVAGVAGFGALIKSSLASGDALAKTSDKIGIATSKLAELHHITSLYTSAGAGAMDEALTKATKRLGEFNATGGGAASKWLEKLNLDTQALANLSPDQLFNTYAESIRGLGDRGSQLAAVSALMGDESRALIGIIDQAPASLAAAAAEADALGLSLSRVDAAKMEAANDSFTRFKGITTGIGNTLAVQLSPFLEAAANGITKMAIESGGFGNVATSAMNHVITAVGYLANAFRGMEIIWQGLRVALAGMVSFVLDKLNNIQQAIFGIINKIPGVDISPFKGLEDAAAAIGTVSAESQAKLLSLLTQPLPSENFKVYTEQIKFLANEQALAIAAAAPGGNSDGTGDRKNIFSGLTPDEMQADYELALNMGQSMVDSFNKQAMQRAKSETAINDLITNSRLAAYNNAVGLLQAFAGRSKTAAIAAIALQKGIAIAQTIMSTEAAAMRALAELGPIAGPPAAATIKTLGAVSVGLIAATGLMQASSIGGGGASLGTPANPVAVTPPPSTVDSSTANAGTTGTINITVNGVLTQDIIDSTLIPAIRDGIDNRDVILISNGSRNAQELMPA